MQERPEKSEASTAPTAEASDVKPQAITQGINMQDSIQTSANRAITVPFHGADLYVFEHDGQPYTPMKALVTAMGLNWSGQFEKVKENEARWGVRNIRMPSDGGAQEAIGLPLRKLPGWLATLEPKKMKSPETAARVIQYQNECDDVLWKYWNDGIAINPRAAYSVQPGQTLSAEQAETLRLLLTENVKKLPKAQQGGAMVKGWSKLKAHFKTDYRHIPAGEFHEAVNILARHVAEWELVDEAPRAEAINELVADWARQIETPNGAPAMLFMPLVNAVLKRQGFKLPGCDLPRLELTMRPPPIGTYLRTDTNRYPANGRTIEVAKNIAADIRNWSDSLPAGHARNDLHEAAQTLYDLLVSCWTEVDEALGQIHTAVHYLNRWQGRGGHIGNATLRA